MMKRKKSNCNNSGYLNHRTYKKCLISEYVDNYVLINLLLPSPTSYIEDLSFSSVQFSSISSCAMNDTQDRGHSNIPLLSAVCQVFRSCIFTPICVMSLSDVLLRVSFGLPHFLFSSEVHVKVWCAILFWCILRVWPMFARTAFTDSICDISLCCFFSESVIRFK